MQPIWTRDHDAVTNTAPTSPAAISAAAHAATTPASGLCLDRGARAGDDAYPTTTPGECVCTPEVQR